MNCEGINTTSQCTKLDKDNAPAVPKLSHGNERFINGFFNRIAPGLFNINGGYNFDAIRLGFDVYNIHDETEKQSIMDKCLVMITAHSEARRKKNGNA